MCTFPVVSPQLYNTLCELSNELGVLLSFRHALQAMKSPSSTFELVALRSIRSDSGSGGEDGFGLKGVGVKGLAGIDGFCGFGFGKLVEGKVYWGS